MLDDVVGHQRIVLHRGGGERPRVERDQQDEPNDQSERCLSGVSGPTQGPDRALILEVVDDRPPRAVLSIVTSPHHRLILGGNR